MAVAPGENRADIAPQYLCAGVLVAAVCTAFAATVSWVVLAMFHSGAFPEEPGYGSRLLIKAVVFTTFASVSFGWILSRVPRLNTPRLAMTPGKATAFRWELILILALTALLVFPNLGRFPGAAPDEFHHLIVARNLGVHGAYASGLPPDALVYFDYYDSVGPTVIAPVAGSLRLLGVDVAHGRVPMALFGLAFPVAVYFLFAGVWGRAAGTLAALMPFGAFGTVYLSRTLYGEVPALTLLILGLLFWRRSIASSSLMFGAAAGLLFGLAVLTKTFLALAAFGFAGVWLYDRATERRIGWRSIVPTALGGLVPLAAWSLVRYLERDLIGEQPSMLVYYRQMLVFGFEPVFEQMPRLIDMLPVIAVSMLLLAVAVPRVFHTQFDPALAVLFLIASMFTFWWVFFTPMHIPRYLWYTAAIAAATGGGVLGANWRANRAVMPRMDRVALAAMLLVAYVVPCGRVATRVYTVDHASADQALVEYVRALPADVPLATTYWPAARLINFAAERAVDIVGETVDEVPATAVLIASELTDTPTSSRAGAPLRFGHYRVHGAEAARFAELKGE